MNRKIMYKGKLVGTLRQDGNYVSIRTKDHFFRKYKGFGLSARVLQEIKRKGCRKITVIYRRDDGESIYQTYPDKFYEEGIIYRDPKASFADYQRILPLTKFNMEMVDNQVPDNSYLEMVQVEVREEQQILKGWHTHEYREKRQEGDMDYMIIAVTRDMYIMQKSDGTKYKIDISKNTCSCDNYHYTTYSDKVRGYKCKHLKMCEGVKGCKLVQQETLRIR